MTRVDFYLLEQGGADRGLHTACRIAEKAWLAGHRIYIHAGDAQLATRLDDLLWTFRQGSFVPHQLITSDTVADPGTPIHIGYRAEPHHHDDVLINMAEDIPLFFSRFTRVVEIVAAEDTAKQQARQRYKFYRDRGYELNTHAIAG